jgi:hypothetical protein
LSTFDGLDISSGGLPTFNTTGYVSIGSPLPSNYKLDVGASSRSYGFLSSSLATPTYRDPPAYEATSGGSLSTNTTFYFKIVAVDGLGGNSLPSIELSFIPTKSNSAVLISWNSVLGAVYYQIWYSGVSQTQVLYLTSDTNEYTFTGTENPFGGVLPTKDTSGAIGIGTSYPSEKLDVTGNAKIRGNIYADKTVVMGTSFRRNRIINGDMKVDQRRSGQETRVLTNVVSVIDRWAVGQTGLGSVSDYRFKTGQNLDNIFPPPGFANYLGIKHVSTVAGIPAGGYASIFQWIEGYNISDFRFGRDNNTTPFTVSFWVYCNRSGIYSIRFVGGNKAANNGSGSWVSYVTTFSILGNELSNWKKIVITVPGTAMNPSDGLWNTTNDRGLAIQICLGASNTNIYTTSILNDWVQGNFAVANTQTGTLFDSNNSIFCITGVQLEPGTEATPYEYMAYNEQLAQCQRYYEVMGASVYTSYAVSSVPAIISSPFKVEKRSTPIMSLIDESKPDGNYTRWNSATGMDKTFMTFGYYGGTTGVTTWVGRFEADSEML